MKYRRVKNEEELAGWEVYPTMVKPSDSQGQRGVFRVESPDELLEKLDTALSASRSRTVILEEVLKGPEVSANAFVVNGRVLVNEVSDRWVLAGYPGGIPRAHMLPAKRLNEVLNDTRALVEQCIYALGIENGPVYFQIILTPTEPRIVEITPRLDGCHLWRLIRNVTGIDLMDATFRLLAGQGVGDLKTREERNLRSLVFFYQAPGAPFFRGEHAPPADALYTEFYLKDGQIVPPVNGHLEKVGYYIKRGLP